MQKKELKSNLKSVGVAPLGDPQSKGITLIALIITIIVMLILVGVSVTVALNGGLFNTAGDAKARTKRAIEEEQFFAAKMAAIGEDGKIDFSILDKNLPEGYTGSNGIYTDPEGRTFVIDENGKKTEVSTVEEVLAEHEYKYYSTFSGAITDSNNSTTANADATEEEGRAALYVDGEGNGSVVLLKDTTEISTINITNDVNINLGGKTLTFTGEGYLNLTGDSNITINGTLPNSKIEAKELDIASYQMIQVANKTLEINGRRI